MLALASQTFGASKTYFPGLQIPECSVSSGHTASRILGLRVQCFSSSSRNHICLFGSQSYDQDRAQGKFTGLLAMHFKIVLLLSPRPQLSPSRERGNQNSGDEDLLYPSYSPNKEQPPWPLNEIESQKIYLLFFNSSVGYKAFLLISLSLEKR